MTAFQTVGARSNYYISCYCQSGTLTTHCLAFEYHDLSQF